MFGLPVALAIAPMRQAGMALIMHPTDALYDNVCAVRADLDDKTLWKYTCQTNQISIRVETR